MINFFCFYLFLCEIILYLCRRKLKITIMKTLEGLSVYEAQNTIREYLKPLFVSKPTQPTIKSKTPAENELTLYVTQLQEYEVDLREYNTKNEFYKTESTRLYSLLEEMIREDSGLNNIPEQYRDKVYSYAWQQGHSYGYGEVYNYLLGLIEIFE